MVALVVAVKFFDDYRLSHIDLAKIGGFGAEDLLVMELEMLHVIRFNLLVTTRMYVSYLRQILRA